MSLTDEVMEAVPNFGMKYVSLPNIKDKPTEANPSPIRMIRWYEHEARIKELEKDAARYQWLCENKNVRWSEIVGFHFDADTGIDEAIDQAINKTKT